MLVGTLCLERQPAGSEAIVKALKSRELTKATALHRIEARV